VAKKAAKKKAAPKKAAAKKATPKKVAPKKAAPKKAAPKKAAAKAPAARKKTASPKTAVQKPTKKRSGPNLEKIQADDYAAAVDLFNRGRYANALKRLQAVEQGPEPGLRHRARVYIKICKQRTESDVVKLKTADDHYNYAIQLMNDRDFDDVDKHLGLALKRASKGADGHIHYAIGVAAAMRDDSDKALAGLTAAIAADPKHRIQAKVDSDWGELSKDPRFAELTAGEEAEPAPPAPPAE